jgi:hypothetical protein
VTYGEVDGSYFGGQAYILTTNYIVTGLTAGITYKFRVQARNADSSSEYSAEVIVLVA